VVEGGPRERPPLDLGLATGLPVWTVVGHPIATTEIPKVGSVKGRGP